jgi:hypothetical protein
MPTISVKYALIWQFKNAPWVQITRCKKVFNTRTGRQHKQVMNGRSIGYWVGGEFIPLSKVNEKTEKIPEPVGMPF